MEMIGHRDGGPKNSGLRQATPLSRFERLTSYLAEEPVGEKQSGLVGSILGLFEERFVAKRSEVRRHD